MSVKRDSPRRVALAMMKGKPIATSVPAIRYHASDDELEELYPSTDDEKRLTPELDKNSPRQPSSPSSPLKTADKKVSASSEDVLEEARADSSLQEGTPPSSDPWKVFSEIKGKITKTFEEKLCEIKNDRRRKSRSPKENSSISDFEDLGDVTPSDENSVDKQRRESSSTGVRQRSISARYVGFSRVKTGLKDKSLRDECVESGVEAAEFSEDVYEGVVFGLDTEEPPPKTFRPVLPASTNGHSTSIVRTPVQIHPVVPPSLTKFETIFSRLANQLIYQLAYRSAAFVIIAVCLYYFTPLPECILGFMVGVFATVTFCNTVATIKKVLTSLPEEKPVASQSVPVLEIPAVEEHAVVERFEGWLNELPYTYNPDDYHVARTKSVFFRLEGDILRIMETRIKIPKRAVWDEPRHKLRFTKRRAYSLVGASVELLPQGLIRRRRWSKKYPICITLKKEALISNVTLRRHATDDGIQHIERNRRRIAKKRKVTRRRRLSEKDTDESKRENKGKRKQDAKGLVDAVLNERRDKRKDVTDDVAENSELEIEEDDDEEGDDTLDYREFDEEGEEEEDDEDYYDEEYEEEEDWERDPEMDDMDEIDWEDEWLDEEQVQKESKERKHSERSEDQDEEVKQLKMETVEDETFELPDGRTKLETKESRKEDEKEEEGNAENKAAAAAEEPGDGREGIRGAKKGGLRTKGLKKTFREGQDGDGNNSEIKLFIFARADRQKEDWYRRLVSAASQPIAKRNHSSPSVSEASSSSSLLSHAVATEPKLFPSANHSSDGITELSYNAYMAKYLDSRLLSPPESASSACIEDVLWINGLIARILFDMHNCPETINLIQDRIQRKLSNIKLPYFMECLSVSEVVIGQGAPVIRSITKPVHDERGFWLELDISYKGCLTMTVETKLNLMKLTRTGSVSSNTSDVLAAEKAKPTARSPIFDSDVEDTPETSTEDEDSAKMRVCGTTKETQVHSSGKKFLSMVDKIAANKYFQHATELSYVRRAMEGVSNTEIRLMVTVSGIEGCLAVNIPPAPSDRLWYGFKPVPKISLTVKPAVGERAVNIVYVTKWIEAKLLREFEKLVVLPNMDDLVLPLCPNYPYVTTR